MLNNGFRNTTAAKLKVLVADDEKVIANSLVAIFKMSGFEARAVYDGRAAVDALSSFNPDVLISDVVMPEMTGVQVAMRALELCPNCKVVLFSGQASTADLLLEARAQGHNFEILTKPVHPSDLLQKLRTAGSPHVPHSPAITSYPVRGGGEYQKVNPVLSSPATA